MKSKSLTIRIPYGDDEINAAANFLKGKKNRETLRKFLIASMQEKMTIAKEQVGRAVAAGVNI